MLHFLKISIVSSTSPISTKFNLHNTRSDTIHQNDNTVVLSVSTMPPLTLTHRRDVINNKMANFLKCYSVFALCFRSLYECWILFCNVSKRISLVLDRWLQQSCNHLRMWRWGLAQFTAIIFFIMLYPGVYNQLINHQKKTMD